MVHIVGERVNIVREKVNIVGDRVNIVGERVNIVRERVNIVHERVNIVGEIYLLWRGHCKKFYFTSDTLSKARTFIYHVKNLFFLMSYVESIRL